MSATNLPKKRGSRRIWRTILGFGEDKHGKSSKYEQYLFIISILIMSLSVLALLNGYFHLINISFYGVNQKRVSSPFLLAGYLGMFISVAFLVPDYVLVPVCGYLSLIGLFNPFYTFLVCLAGALLPIEYVCGRFAARPVLLKILSLLYISEKSLEAADRWILEHGMFSIFLSTFVPFFYSAIALTAGTMKMKPSRFFLSSFAGYGLKYVFLEAVGYYGVFVFTISFDYSQRTLFFLLLILTCVYVSFYLTRTLVRWRGRVSGAAG